MVDVPNAVADIACRPDRARLVPNILVVCLDICSRRREVECEYDLLDTGFDCSHKERTAMVVERSSSDGRCHPQFRA